MERIGSVNFVKLDADGRLTGDNVDGVGFIDGLVRSGIEPKGKRVLQLGAGGAGLAPEIAVAEIIMTPERTPILEAALARGCRISLGRHMLEE